MASHQWRIMGRLTGSNPVNGAPTARPSYSFNRAWRSSSELIDGPSSAVGCIGSSGLAGHLQAGGGDDVALDVVDAAAEGVDLGGPSGPLEPALEHGPRRALPPVPGGAHDAEEQPVDLDVGLGAEHLHGRGVGR